mgnify:CR=1 FL=1
MLRRLTCAIFLALAGFIGGCAQTPQTSYSTRNTQFDLDLQSTVRGQSNDLLEMTQQLQSFAQKGFLTPQKLTRELETTASQIDQIQMNVPTLLADQDVEIAELRQQVRRGTASDETLKTRAMQVSTYRTALLASLNASATRTASTLHALRSTKLNNQRLRLRALDQDLGAVRSMIEMQM